MRNVECQGSESTYVAQARILEGKLTEIGREVHEFRIARASRILMMCGRAEPTVEA